MRSLSSLQPRQTSPSASMSSDLQRGFWLRMLGMLVILGILVSLPFTMPLIITWFDLH